MIPTPPQAASLEEERREILTSVMGVLAGNSPDPDEMAACSYLLKHLIQYRRLHGPQRV
jgi:plasmid stability protein